MKQRTSQEHAAGKEEGSLAITRGQVQEMQKMRMEVEAVLMKIESLAKLSSETAFAEAESDKAASAVYWPSVFEIFTDLTEKGKSLIEEMDTQLSAIGREEGANHEIL